MISTYYNYSLTMNFHYNRKQLHLFYIFIYLLTAFINTQNPISGICIQESWGHEEIDIRYFSFPNYTLINANRRLSLHGGLITYIHDDFTFKELNDMIPISGTSTLSESLFIIIIIIIIIYLFIRVTIALNSIFLLIIIY